MRDENMNPRMKPIVDRIERKRAATAAVTFVIVFVIPWAFWFVVGFLVAWWPSHVEIVVR